MNHDEEFFKNLAVKQVESGAHYIDVSVASGKADKNQEIKDMEWAVKIIQEVVDVPLAIDTTDPDILEAGLKHHKGQAMINSISYESLDRLDIFLELAKKYQAKLVALPTTDKGIPPTPEERIEVCMYIIGAAKKHDIKIEDIYFDPLVLPISVDINNVVTAIETLKGIKALSPKTKTTLGLSNVSFGMPNRDVLNQAFLLLALKYLDSAILNPLDEELIGFLTAGETLLGDEKMRSNYLRAFRKKRAPKKKEAIKKVEEVEEVEEEKADEVKVETEEEPKKEKPKEKDPVFENLSLAVQEGDIEKVKEVTKKAIDDGFVPEEILDDGLMMGMEVVGEKFSEGEMFIPEVLKSGETLKISIEILQPYLKAEGPTYKGKILMATVEGDIHDLGKNLVGMNLTANGFEVIDIGINISATEIIEQVKKHNPDILGLSALLTTTMPEMEKVVNLLEENGLRDSCKVILGGAPVSEEYAEEINADLYAENAIEAVSVINSALAG